MKSGDKVWMNIEEYKAQPKKRKHSQPEASKTVTVYYNFVKAWLKRQRHRKV